MERHLIVIAGLLLGSTAFAQASLEPVQHVYPDSTLEEIQQAIDNGGTVYFERLTKTTMVPGEYNQVARNAPDLPPTPDDPAKGFNVGKNGKDVHIIGVLGLNGERPRINGGTVVFRVGRAPSFGFFGLPVSFRIENLELFNPELAFPLVYSRIGIFVTLLGAQSTINNCNITVTGKDTDPGHAINHSVGIWFYLPSTQPQSPPSGARIDVTNNAVIATRTHEGIHVDSFWPVTTGFTPPRAFIGNNTVEVSNLGGYPNQLGTNGATIATAIVLQGNLPNSIVANNTISGDGRSPGASPPVESVGIYAGANPGDVLSDLMVSGNDSSGFTGDFQMRVDSVVAAGTIARNSFGPADIAGIKCWGRDNRFVNNHFFGPYPGWVPPANGPGLFWFTITSQGNTVEATKLNGPPHGSDICGQILDDTGGANEIRGYERCRDRSGN